MDAGNGFTILGIPVTLTDYSQTAVPAMLSVFCYEHDIQIFLINGCRMLSQQ